MFDEFVHNNPHDPKRERVARMEVQATNVNRNMKLLMVD